MQGKLMTGSDIPEWYLAPGFSVHDEIESYVKAGLSNFAALQTATINPATYLGIDKRKKRSSQVRSRSYFVEKTLWKI
jgi:adenine deaminase